MSDSCMKINENLLVTWLKRVLEKSYHCSICPVGISDGDFISHCGMFNLESQYAATEEMFFVNHDLGGPFWDKNNATAQKSFANSPHRFIQNWDTPILIISGEYDFRIPYTESLQAFHAAKLVGVDARLMIFPDETHFVLKPQNSILWQREFFKFLDEHLK